MLERVYAYSADADTLTSDTLRTFTYKKSVLHIDKKNIILLAVPTMFVVANGGKREYITETYDEVLVESGRHTDTQRKITVSTIPHFSKTLPNLLKYLTPELYKTTMIGRHLLSPFLLPNHRFYKFKISVLNNGKAQLFFKPKINNTQLVSGDAVVDTLSGRILQCNLHGEFDMISFSLQVKMGEKKPFHRLPSYCKLSCRFRFLGNQITNTDEAHFLLPPNAHFEANTSHESLQLMALVRPDTLTPHQDSLLQRHYRVDTVPKRPKKEASKFKKILWDIIGDNLVNRISSNFGSRKQGYVRISPILNPLYVEYSRRRGVTYKFDVRGNYVFNDNQLLTARLKLGYSFRQKQLYGYLPATLYLNRRKNTYLQLEIGSGGRIYNALAAQQIMQQAKDTVRLEEQGRIDEFKNTYVTLRGNADLSDKFSVQAGLIYHRREALEKNFFDRHSKPPHYNSAAPVLSVVYRPMGWKGPVLAVDYERSLINFLKSNIGYERWEADLQYIHSLTRLQSLSMRVGAGVYTQKVGENYFLDFTNFRETNLPNGWNDDWSGEFELLDAAIYNASNYYVRSNFTYESPILLLSRVPWGGRYVEMERLYASTLTTDNTKFYCELGYGFSTRLFSMGVFLGVNNGKITGVSCKFGFELFRRW